MTKFIQIVKSMAYKEYLKLNPTEMEQAINKFPLALIPFGALEWHSYHLPLGMDGLKAELLIKKIAERLNKGVVFPCRYWGSMNTMKFPYTHEVSKHGQKKFLKNTLEQLYQMGFRMIIILSGHYPGNFIKLLVNSTKKFMKNHHDAFALGIPEFYLLHDFGYYGDHAAKWETSISMALFPELVDLTKLPDDFSYIQRVEHLGIMGHDPKRTAEKSLGDKLVETFTDRIVDLIEDTWKTKSNKKILEIYENHDKDMKKLINLRNLEPLMKILGMKEKKEFLKHGKWMVFKGSKQQIGKL